MPARTHNQHSETVKGAALSSDGESHEVVPAVERTENYDPDVTLTHDVDGFWFWHVGDQQSEVGYFHPALALQFAPSPARTAPSEK